MKIERMHLKNFRCFDELTINFDKRLTVIIAENGAGKTAILDAIAIGFGRYLTKLPGVTGRSTKESDMRVSQGERREPLMMLAWEVLTRDGTSLVWSGGRRRDGAVNAATVQKLLAGENENQFRSGLKELDNFTIGIVQANAEQNPYFLPVIAYYGTNRAIREEVHRRRGFKKNFSRFDALIGALDPDSRFRAAFEWFNGMEDLERREREARRDFDYRNPELQVVRDAIVRLLPAGFRNPRTETRPLRFVIDRVVDGETRTLRISQLSDGYRVMLGLAMDFSRRMAQANSRLANDGNLIANPLDLPAIALIDEIDLHLHPSWQQHVLADLTRTFPNTQFIVTTHSPQVLSSVDNSCIRILKQNDNFDDSLKKVNVQIPTQQTKGVASSDVLSEIMFVNPTPPIAEAEQYAQYIAKIEEGTHQDEDGSKLKNKLIKHFGVNHPLMLDAEKLIRFQSIKLKNKNTTS